MEASIRYARSGDLKIAYRVMGDGPLDLVFVPGFVSDVQLPMSHPKVARFYRRLASFSRLILFDKRGQGCSDRPGRPPTLEESMEDLVAVMDAVGSERAALFGISEGGPMSILAAAVHSARVSSLVLCGTYARLIEAPDYPEGFPEATLDRLNHAIEHNWGGPVLLDEWAPSECNDPEFRAYWAQLLRSGASPRGAIELLELYRETDVRPALSAVKCPTLVLHRKDDLMVPASQGRYIAAHIPGARYVELEGSDHLGFAGDVDGLIDEVEQFLIGSRRTTEPDRALATILFTDIVDSTATAARLGDSAWRDLLERHDEIVRRQLRLYDGRERKALGDGFLATFEGPARAIRCAEAIRASLAATGLDVRSGVHTGEVELRGEDVSGIAVNIGARVGALADPGEVLVSGTVKDLIVGSGIEFTDRGRHELKGVPGEWSLFALAA